MRLFQINQITLNVEVLVNFTRVSRFITFELVTEMWCLDRAVTFLFGAVNQLIYSVKYKFALKLFFDQKLLHVLMLKINELLQVIKDCSFKHFFSF